MVAQKVKIGELLLREGIIDQDQLAHALEEHKRSGLLIGKILVRLGMVNEDLLESLLNKQLKSRDSRRLGEILVEQGLVSASQMDAALEMSKRSGQKLGAVLVKKGFLDEDALVEILAERQGIPQIRLDSYDFPQQILTILPEDICRQLRLIPLAVENNKLRIAMVDPSDLKASDIVRFKAGMEVESLMATEKDVLESIERVYRKREPFSRSSKDSLVQSIEKMYEAQKQLVESQEKALVQQRVVLASVQEMLLIARQK